jgi:hypothetical protein
MATTTWASFYPYVQPYVPGCPEIVIESHLQEAAADFCAESEVWRYTIEPDFTSNGTSDYEIDVPKGTFLENIMYLYLDGNIIQHVSERHFRVATNKDGSAIKGTPTYFSVLDDNSIRLYPMPDGKYTFNGLGVLKPILSATGVETFIFTTHGRSIASGAIARLAEIPNKEWSNPELAMQHRIDFERRISSAKGRDTRRTNLRVAAIRFAD